MKNIITILFFLLLFSNCKKETTNERAKQHTNLSENINELDSLSVFNFIMNKKWVYQQKDTNLSDKTFVINENKIVYDNSIEPILCEIDSFKRIKKNKYEIIVKKECHSKFYFEILDPKKKIVIWEYVNSYMNINEREKLITYPFSAIYRKD